MFVRSILTREAIKVDHPQKFEETNPMFGVLCEILIYHGQSWLKDSL